MHLCLNFNQMNAQSIDNYKTYQLVGILTYDLGYWHDYNVCSQPPLLPPLPLNGDCWLLEGRPQGPRHLGTSSALNWHYSWDHQGLRFRTALFVTAFLVSDIWPADFGTKPKIKIGWIISNSIHERSISSSLINIFCTWHKFWNQKKDLGLIILWKCLANYFRECSF